MLAPAIRFVIPSVIAALALTSCSAEEPTDETMPDVVGKKLDVAQSDVQRAGYENEVEVVGGGTFGVVVESNWTVCNQLPEAGESISEQPRLTVERTCTDGEDGATTDPAPSSPSAEPSPTDEAEAEESGTGDAEQDDVLTSANDDELKTILTGSDTCGDPVVGFIRQHEGTTIRFDGSIAAMQNHGDYDTRYDILVAPGDAGPESVAGPSFQLRDVSMSDLNLTGPVPDRIGVGGTFTFTADIVGEIYPSEANWNCLFYLDPVSTQAR